MVAHGQVVKSSKLLSGGHEFEPRSELGVHGTSVLLEPKEVTDGLVVRAGI